MKNAIKQDVALADYTTFKIGGRAQYFVEVKSADELTESVKWSRRQGLPFFILGGGSNLLADDQGFKGLIIKMANRQIEFLEQKEKCKVKAGAGLELSFLVDLLLEKGLSGLEWACGIPQATVGGSVFMNAGAFGANMADIVCQVEAFDSEKLEAKNFSFEECQFGYKNSLFKRNKNLIILSAALLLEKREKKEIKEEMNKVLQYRKNNHPLDSPSAGSIFKNPPAMSAGELIEKCGLSGKKIGGAEISAKHSNFIVNSGRASSSDVKELVSLSKRKVKEKFNVVLEEELEYLP